MRYMSNVSHSIIDETKKVRKGNGDVRIMLSMIKFRAWF